MFNNATCLIIKCYNLMRCHGASVANSCVFVVALIIFDVVLQATASEYLGVIVRVFTNMHFFFKVIL